MFVFILTHYLLQVFDKALNESTNSVDSNELNGCCGSVKAQIGISNVQKVYVNMIGKAQLSIEEAFDNICQLQNVEEIIRKSMNAGGDTESSKELFEQARSVNSQLDILVHEEKEREKERLATAIQQLDLEVKRNREALSRLKSQVQNEIAAATEECQKMAVAAAQIGNIHK